MALHKQALIQAVAPELGLNEKQTEKAINAVFRTLVKLLAEEQTIYIYGFGKFAVTKLKEHKWTNPITGKEHLIPERKFPKFYAGASLIEAVRKDE